MDEIFFVCKINCNMMDDDFEELRFLLIIGIELFFYGWWVKYVFLIIVKIGRLFYC